jgi:hypothetical protein
MRWRSHQRPRARLEEAKSATKQPPGLPWAKPNTPTVTCLVPAPETPY